MAWNQPGNNGQDRDPWGSSNNQGGNSANRTITVSAAAVAVANWLAL
ncbi:MAG: hypothetical protein K0S95_2900 [Pantoea eucrina]|nr:hypothetical protein [Pantoea eucrina]